MPAPPSRRITIAPVKERRPRRPKPVDADFESLLEFTGFYDVYYDALREELWTSARLAKTGLLRYPTIKYVPPACAMMFFRSLEEHLGEEVETDDEQGRASIIYTIGFPAMQFIEEVCCFDMKGKLGNGCCRLTEPHGSLHIVAHLRVEYHEGRGSSPVSKIEMDHTVWKLHPAGDLRPGTSLMVHLGKYMQVQEYAKRAVLGWPRPDDLAPSMRAWAALPPVRPVTRKPPKDWARTATHARRCISERSLLQWGKQLPAWRKGLRSASAF